jgi:SAM-dependent methyltransferase
MAPLPPPDMSPAPNFMTPEQARVCFDQHAFTYELQYAHHRHSLPQFIRAADLQTTDTVLDLGCGIGWNAHLAAPACRYVIAIDVSLQCCLRAIVSAHEAGLRNVALGQGDMTDLALLRQRIQRAKTWTTDFVNNPQATYNGGQRLSDIAADIPTSVSMRFSVIFICWVMHMLDDTTKQTFLAMIRDHFLAPGGRIVITWSTPTTRMATIAVGYALKPITGGPYSKMGTAINEYVGHRRDVEDARHDLRQTVHSLGFRVNLCRAFPNWQDLEMTDATSEIRLAAQRLSGEENPAWQWLELARQQRHGGMMDRLGQDMTYQVTSQERGPNERMEMAPLHSVAAVLAVLTYSPSA